MTTIELRERLVKLSKSELIQIIIKISGFSIFMNAQWNDIIADVKLKELDDQMNNGK